MDDLKIINSRNQIKTKSYVQINYQRKFQGHF
jgi:hypothetical protein